MALPADLPPERLRLGVGSVQASVIIIATSLLAIIAYYDLTTRRIPNTLSIAIVALGLIRMALIADPVAVCHTLAATVLIFVATFLLFWRGMIGGGDAKLISALALLIGHQKLISFLFSMSAFGGVLGLAVLARDKLTPGLARLGFARAGRFVPELGRPTRRGSTVPYGLAIAAAGVITLIIVR